MFVYVPLLQIFIINRDILQGSFRLCKWFSLWSLEPWINHLPRIHWSNSRKSVWNYSSFVLLVHSLFLIPCMRKYSYISQHIKVPFVCHIFTSQILINFCQVLFFQNDEAYRRKNYNTTITTACFNLLRPRDAYIRHQSRPSLVQIIACGLFGAKPLSKPMLGNC